MSNVSAKLQLPVVCPFCGVMNDNTGRACGRCGLVDTAEGRAATKSRIGPWFVLQNRNPAAPGMKFETLRSLIGRGFVTRQSVVRGPTTHQLWQPVVKVRGVSREFNLCYSCGCEVASDAVICSQCNRSQLPPAEPNALLEPAGVVVEGNGETQVAVESGDAVDVLSPRELAMIFHLDYDPNAKVSPEASPTTGRRQILIPALAAIAAFLVLGWILLPTRHKAAIVVAKVEPATQPVVIAATQPVVQLVPLPREEAEPAIVASSEEVGIDKTVTMNVQKLWKAGLDAEGRRDFAVALKSYQAIENYPNVVWPGGLKTRVNLTRQEILVGTY